MDRKIEFRKAETADAELLINIYNSAFYSDYVRYGECPAYGRTKEMMVQSIINYPKFLILYDSRPVGCVSCKETETGVYEIGCLCVIPEFQGKGIGTAAMEFIKTCYQNWKMITLVTPADKTGNIRFYTEKCGFAIRSVEMDGNVRVARFVLEREMLETEHLIVRKFKIEDAQQLYENHMDEEVRKWFPNECYADPAEAQDAIRFFSDCIDNGHLPFVLGVELKGTGELIGDAGISEVEGKPEETEIGYCIGQKYRGKGYATELLGAITGFAASRFGVRVIWGRVVHGNHASAKVLEKNGYRFEKEEFGAADDPYGNGMLVYRYGP